MSKRRKLRTKAKQKSKASKELNNESTGMTNATIDKIVTVISSIIMKEYSMSLHKEMQKVQMKKFRRLLRNALKENRHHTHLTICHTADEFITKALHSAGLNNYFPKTEISVDCRKCTKNHVDIVNAAKNNRWHAIYNRDNEFVEDDFTCLFF